MKPYHVGILVLGIGAGAFWLLRQSTLHTRPGLEANAKELAEVRQHVNELIEALATLPENAGPHPQQSMRPKPGSPNAQAPAGTRPPQEPDTTARSWSELREQLGIGWDSSPEHLLISKETLRKINFKWVDANAKLTPMAVNVLALSPEEQAGIQEAIGRCRSMVVAQIERTGPSGDIIAQYSLPFNPALEQTLSDQFVSEVTAIVGGQRADLLSDRGWQQLRTHLIPPNQETSTLLVRRQESDGDSQLTWELHQGNSISKAKVAYGAYPTGWFLQLFPGGWAEFAAREGVQLPPNFGQ